MRSNRQHSIKERGSIVVSILIITTFLFTTVSSLIVLANSNLSRAKGRIQLLEAQYAAESGADAAIANLNADTTASYAGTGATEVTVLTNNQYKATFITSVVAGVNGNQKVITSTGKVYRAHALSTVVASRKIEVVTERTTTEVNSSSVLSRNIIDVQSGVKNITAKDLFVNGYINMNKNTTNLIAENITVGGKNTGASNCSIGGSGNLVKPTTFSNPGQTKTKLTLAYNNCISPPGNSNNANFDVLTNQTNISKVQSTYIPWSQFMDNTYTNSFNNCGDWTSGTFPRTIPSSGHTKQTHYPDNGSNISTSCGTSGDLTLATGQYNITDNVHIRASLCAASGCSPTFYNPSPTTTRYIFVEGSVNFDGVQTASGSGPIVLIAYGADPASKTGSCPYGGAIYIGSGSSTSAPKLYMVALNGLCIDKTKFGSDPALGGISGKNLYIASNPGTPFDLAMDTAFPTSSVPIDLAWHASRYRRL
jgi:hypothetical protein